MVRAGLEVLEIQRDLDLDDRMQYGGRVLALRFAKFWVLGLYVPHKESEYNHLLEQITSWTARANMPVVRASVFIPLVSTTRYNLITLTVVSLRKYHCSVSLVDFSFRLFCVAADSKMWRQIPITRVIAGLSLR